MPWTCFIVLNNSEPKHVRPCGRMSVENVQSVVKATQKAVKAFSQLEIVKGSKLLYGGAES
jgi:hypothetical protein